MTTFFNPQYSIIYKGFNVHGHPFHLVNSSNFPFLVGVYSFVLLVSAVSYMHYYVGGGVFLLVSLLSMTVLLFAWWWEVIREATFEGRHTVAVQTGLRYGMILFIVSEIMFFFGFFWAFFHSSLSPAITIGGVWPPPFIDAMSPWGLPFLNTLILLSSGASITWAHYSLVSGVTNFAEDEVVFDLGLYNILSRVFLVLVNLGVVSNPLALHNLAVKLSSYSSNFNWVVQGFIVTLGLGAWFLSLQFKEYVTAPFTLADSIYGSLFFMLTGFHGFHVLVGVIFLTVCFYRYVSRHFTARHHVGFEAAIWYWHFVDIVWLGLFCLLYWWGGPL